MPRQLIHLWGQGYGYERYALALCIRNEVMLTKLRRMDKTMPCGFFGGL